jgi:prepilin-type N-terminal cleavage/methylation domain-containing protein/prepilin-type processing-associated H-X9-DG protein
MQSYWNPRGIGRRSAFTLIELLVVIAIIAILAAILFPVFAQARDKARQASCLSNIKQQALAFNMYAQDYDERLPFWAPQCHAIWASAGTCGNVAPGVPIGRNYTGSLWIYALQPYIKNAQFFGCPSDGQRWTVVQRVGPGTGVGWINFTQPDPQGLPNAGTNPAINTSVLSYGVNALFTRYIRYNTLASIDRVADALIVADATQVQLGMAGLGGPLNAPHQGWLDAEAAGAPANDPRRNILMSQASFPVPEPRICVANAGVTVPADFPNGPISASAPNIQQAVERCTRHQQGSNVGFVDGHAKYIKATQITGRYFGIDR